MFWNNCSLCETALLQTRGLENTSGNGRRGFPVDGSGYEFMKRTFTKVGVVRLHKSARSQPTLENIALFIKIGGRN